MQFASADTPARRRIETVLLVGNPYSAFLLEEAGFRPRGEEHPAEAPTFDLARSAAEALQALERARYEMLITDHHLPDMSGRELASRVRKHFPEVPVVVVTGNTDLGGPIEGPDADPHLFIAFGAPSFWRALVRLQEDEGNAAALIEHGSLAILLVEDEPNFYSHFLPTLYERIRACAIELLPEDRRPRSPWANTNRPLVLLRRSFEEACAELLRCGRGLMALITDLCFPLGGDRRGDAGLRLLYRARAIHGHLPVVVASRDWQHRDAVIDADAKFLWKDSPRLLSELDSFLIHFCGFGPFVFRWPAGDRYGVAHTLSELRGLICDVPDVVFEHHALHHDFSTWLAVHGYQRLAREARRLQLTEADLRAKVLQMIDAQLQRGGPDDAP